MRLGALVGRADTAGEIRGTVDFRIGQADPPAVTHPEYFYGFIGVTLAWQLAFVIIARDPARYRLMMLPSIVEKAAYGVGTLVLLAAARVNALLGIFALIDLLLGLAFLRAFYVTRSAPHSR